jgi:hypothetical protein
MRLIGLAFVLTLSLIIAPLAAEAQQAGKLYRIGLLGGSPPNSPGGRLAWEGFFQGLRELGYVDGQNILVEGRSASGCNCSRRRFPESPAWPCSRIRLFHRRRSS